MRQSRHTAAFASLIATLLLTCDASPTSDPKVVELCRAHDGRVLAFDWRSKRSILPVAPEMSREQDAAWRAQLALPPLGQHSMSPQDDAAWREQVGLPQPTEPSIEWTSVVFPVTGVQRLGDGWLVGTNGGEWGGGLYYFFQDERPPLAIARARVRAVIGTARGAYVVSGIAHGFPPGDGEFQFFSASADGPIAGPELHLPSAPMDIAHQDGVTFVAGGFDKPWALAFPWDGTAPTSARVRSACK